MNHRLDHVPSKSSLEWVSSARSQPADATLHSTLRLRLDQWLPGSAAAILGIFLVGGLPFYYLHHTRQLTRTELAHFLQTDKPDPVAILRSFDRATEEIFYAVSRLYLALTLATVFLVAHLAGIKRRLNAAERNIQTLRDVVLGVDGISLK